MAVVSGISRTIGRTLPSPHRFSHVQFKNDVSKLCTTLNAAYNENVMDRVLEAYNGNFSRGAVLWKATNRQKDGIAFRFYERDKVDVIGPAIKHGLLKDHHKMIPLISSWANLKENAIASCDFDPAKGLNKTWVWLGGRYPLEELLNAPNVPPSLCSLGTKLKSINLHTVRHAAVDWRSSTVNIYFWVPGALTLPVVNSLINLSGAEPIDEKMLATMKPFFRPQGFTFATTINVATGNFKRVAFYALRLDSKRLPVMGDKKSHERLSTFFKEAANYDEREMNIVAWSFAGGSSGSSNYIKGERSYCGNLEEVLSGWGSPIGTAPPRIDTSKL